MGLSVQSSQRISIPGHLIISATKIQLAESIGQGKSKSSLSLCAPDKSNNYYQKSGEFGIVYKGFIANSDIVAIKTLKGSYFS